jgi:hypothetical protein
MLKSILTLMLLSFSLLSFAKWELNDVSYLFPLPGPKDGKDFLLGTSKLLPSKLLYSIDQLVMGSHSPQDPVALLKVIGMRIDPCFNFQPLPKKGPCSPQIRLIWQPIYQPGTSEVSTYDAALHSFHELGQQEFTQLLKQLQDLKMKNAQAGVHTIFRPLNIHPAWLNTSTRQSFNTEIKRLILATASTQNLVRLTFMKRLTPEIWWAFGGMDKKADGSFKPMTIARLGSATQQDFFNDDFHEAVGMKGTLLPNATTSKDNLQDLVAGWGISHEAKSLSMVKSGLTALNRIENPRIHNPASMDCVSCHITDAARLWLKKKHPQIYQTAQNTEDSYTQDFLFSHQLKNVTISHQHNKSIRAFGYFDHSPSINQRVINESAAVADELNR